MKRFRFVSFRFGAAFAAVFSFALSFSSDVQAQGYRTSSVRTQTRSAQVVAAEPADWAARLFEETSRDYRGIPRGTLAKRSFRFVNNLDREIRLVGARSSCGCTKVYLPEQKRFKPGESGEIVAEIDAVRYAGVRKAVVTVLFDGPNRAEVALEVRGVVVENVRLEPRTLKFIVDETADSLKGENGRVRQTIFTGFNETIGKIESSNPFLTVEVGRPIPTRSGLRTPLTVSLKDDAPAGYFNDVVYLWPNGASRATPLALAVEGVVRPKITVAPPTLSFASDEKRGKIVKNVVVAGSKPFTIKSAVSSSPAVEIDVRAARQVASAPNANASSVYVLPVAFDPARLDVESTTTVLTFETSDGQTLTLEAVLSAENFARKTEPKSLNETAIKPDKRPTKAAASVPRARVSFR